MTKILAIDPGTVNIGVAISDPDQTIAFARTTVKNTPEGIQQILDICESENVTQIIIGKPLNPSPHWNGEEIAQKLQFKNIKYFNEDFTTQEGIETLNTASKDHSFKDELAARLILQRYLDESI